MVHRVVRLATMGVAYFAALRLGLFFVAEPEGIASIWPASGLALAFLLLGPRSEWAEVLGVIFFTNIAGNLSSGNSLPVSIGYAMANTLEPMLGAWVLTRVCGKNISFHRTREINWLFGVALFVNGITAMAGAGVSAIAFSSKFLDSWLVWWASNGLGIILVAPVIVSWSIEPTKLHLPRLHRAIETAAVLLVLIGFAWLLFGSFSAADNPVLHNYMLFPILIWLAFRYNPRFMATAMIPVAAIAISNVLQGYGVFAFTTQSITEHLVSIQLYLGIVTFSGLFLSTIVAERAEAEEKLSQLSQAIEQSPESIVITDTTGAIEYVNNKFVELTGYTREEAMGENPNILKSGYTTPEAYAQLWQTVTTGGEWRGEFRNKKKNGELYWEAAKISSIVNARGVRTHFLAVKEDITERKRTEEAVRTMRILLEQTFEQSPVAMVLVSMPDAIIRIANPACIQFLNMEDEPNPVNASLLDLKATWKDYDMQGNLGSTADLPLPGALRGLRTDGEERYIIRKDGSLRNELVYASPIYDTDGNLIAGYCIMLDITERKHTTELLAQEKERLSVTLRSIGDGVITTDTNGTIVMLNKAAEDMTGWKSDQAAGRALPEVFHIINELTREPCDNPVETVLSTGAICELANHTCLISKDGREIDIADSGAPIRDNESRITGVVLVFRDVTEKKKLSESMQRAQKLESLGILAGGIAHDFNNMLAGIFGYLELARESAADNKTDQIPRHLGKALAVFDRAKGLTQQLLTFSKGGTPVRKTISIAPLIEHSTTFALSGSNVTCEFHFAEDLWLCDCDENQIGQAIDNIVINGKQAMPMGGRISVSAVNVCDEPGHSGAFVKISIRDQGIGMPKDILPKIFDPFFSTKTTGHGLGLATVFSILQRHDGWIEVESKSGVGTTFHLFIPASHTKQASDTTQTTLNHRGSGTVLVMDDEDFMLEIVGDMLQGMGYAVAQAKDGHEALELFKTAVNSGRPFVASILDLTIPGGTGGRETAVKMRKIDPMCKIIASSGYSENPIISNPTLHGFTDRIVKPYRKDELMEVMMRVAKP
jgi:PAS domain S-box-containing protein